MIYCPKCGTANRDQSRFCNECGEELGNQTRVKCPHCGTLNPVQNVFCTECRGRLLPSFTPTSGSDAPTAIKGLSLPTKTSADGPAATGTAASKPEAEDEIPAWLRELGNSLSKEDKRGGEDAVDDGSEIPGWLRDLRDSLPEQPEAEMDGALQEEPPEWVSRLQPPAAAAEQTSAASAGDEDQVPDEEAATQPLVEKGESKPVPTDSEPEDDQMPGWLAELRSSSTGAKPETAPPSSDVGDEESPDWLTDLGSSSTGTEPEPAPPPSDVGDEEMPAWLTELRSSFTRTEPESALPSSDLVDEESAAWLAELPSDASDEEREPTLAQPIAEKEEEEEETPAWLAELQAGTIEDEVEPASVETDEEEEEEAAAEEIPTWLAELRAGTIEDETELAPVEPDVEAEETAEEETLAWLAELRAGTIEDETEPAPVEPDVEAEETAEEETPAWLAELRAETTEDEPKPAPVEPDAEAEETAEEETPAWLTELQTEPIEAESELAPTEPEAEEEEEEKKKRFDGLAAFAATVIATESVPEPSIPDIEETEIPDWLSDFQPTPRDSESISEVLDEEAAFPALESPEWLAELQADIPDESPTPVEEMLGAETPDWLVPSEPGLEEEESLARAEIPAWLLALKPAELREEGEEEELAPEFEEPVEETGILAGIQGTLPVEMVIAQPRAVSMVELIESPVTETPESRLFAQVVGSPPEAAPKEVVPTPIIGMAPLTRWILYLILIAVAVLPFLLGTPLLSRAPEPDEATLGLYDSIEALSSDSPVLVAFDYDPTTSGEMEILAQAVVGHLMDRGTRVVAVSLLPAGPATAQFVLDELAAERTSYADSYGQRYVNLGYLPGQAAAVRLLGLSLETAFARDFEGTLLNDLPVMQGLNNTQSFALILELAAAQDTLRWWIEQAGTPYDVPLGTAVSASVAPLAVPYYQTESQQLIGLLGGVSGAASYEALLSNQDTPTDTTAARLDAQLAGALVLVLVLLIGNIIYLAQRGTRREG